MAASSTEDRRRAQVADFSDCRGAGGGRALGGEQDDKDGDMICDIV